MDIKNTVWVIIPVHNRRLLTCSCLESLYRQNISTFKVIIVDDGSDDGTKEMLVEKFPDTIVLKGSGRDFWTKSCNQGVQFVLTQAKQEDYILTLNNDLTVEPAYIQILLESAIQYPDAIIGSLNVRQEDKETVISAGVKINWLTAKFQNLLPGTKRKHFPSNEKIIEVDALPGRGTLIPVAIFKKIGIYNEEKLPHYAADFEFSIRAKRSGHRLFVNRDAVVFSKIEETGLNNALRKISWGEYWSSFSSIKSPANLKYRWNFAQLCCPPHLFLSYYFLDLIRTVFGSLRNQIFGKRLS